MSFTLTTSAAILYLAGSNHPLATHGNSAAMIAKFSDEAEAVINASTRKDWVADYADVTANFKPILDDAAASYADAYVNHASGSDRSLTDELIRTKRLKVGRNDPCPCESGIKFKKCCDRF